jgi:hypothetical protein
MAGKINIRPTERIIDTAGTTRESIPDIEGQVHEIAQGAALSLQINHNLERAPVGMIVIDKGGFTDVRFDFAGIADTDRDEFVKIHRENDERVKVILF